MHINKIERFPPYFLIIILTFLSDDSLIAGSNVNNFFSHMKIVVFSLIAIALLFSFNLKKRVLIHALLLCILIFSTMILTFDIRLGYFYQFLIICTSLYISTKIPLNDFLKFFFNVVVLIAFLSILMLIIKYLIPSIYALFPHMVNSSGEEYKSIGLVSAFIENEKFRNTGAFREPGVFAIFLALALWIDQFILNKSISGKSLVIIFSMATTFSTIGIFLLIIIYFFSLIKNVKSLSLVARLINIIILLVICFFIFKYVDIFFSKLTADSSGHESTLARTISFLIGFILFTESPFWGVGLFGYEAGFSQLSFSYFGIDFTSGGQGSNTLIALLATYGIFLASLFFYGLFKFSIIFRGIPLMIIGIIILGALFSQDMRYSILLWCLFFYGVSSKSFIHNHIRLLKYT